MEYIEVNLRSDPGFSADERREYLDAFRMKLAAYGRDIIRGDKERGAEVLMSIVVEGSFDQAPVERTVDVASAAYIAVQRGSDPDTVKGIALYGFRKQVDADRIEAWANGYGTLTQFGVAHQVAEDLVFQAVEHGWDIYTFNTFKWGLVDAVKDGYASDDFEAYMIGTYLKGGERPGEMVASSMRYFQSLGGAKPKLPEYKGSLIPRQTQDVPAPKLDLTRQSGETPPISSAPNAGTSVEKPVKKTVKDETAAETPVRQSKTVPGSKSTVTLAKQNKAVPDRKSVEAPAKRDKPVPKPSEETARGKKSPPSALGYMLRIEDSYKKYLGVPYAWGGTTKQGMDCSGFVQRVFAEAGIRLPRVSREQWKVGTPVARYAIEEGDLVFFRTIGNRISHVGIVTHPAEDQFVHASSSKGVSYALLSWRYFDKRYAGARRIVPGGLADSNDVEIYQTSRLFVDPR